MSTSLSNPPTEFSDPTVVANLMNEQRFGRMMVIAQTMASAALIPEHLLGKKKQGVLQYFTADEIRANCFLIVNQAFRWGMDPFAVMPETYVVGGKLAYQGKLIAGLVNSLANLEERLSYEFSGTKGKDDFTVTVSGKFRGAAAPVTVQVSVGQAKTDNQMWQKDPEQKLVYTGATKWARRWCPEIILGILTDDDAEHIEMRDVTPRNSEPPKVITGGTAEPAAEAAPKGKAKAKSEPAMEAPAVETETKPAAQAVKAPDRATMIADLRTAYRAAGVKTGPEAEDIARKNGFLPEGVSISQLNEADMLKIHENRDTVFISGDSAPAVLHVFYQSHKVTHSAEGAAKAWTMHRLVYQVAGESDVREAVTFSATFQAMLDQLEGGEAMMLTVKPGEKGDTIETLELAPNTGGAA